MPKFQKLSPWKSFVSKWEDCTLCSLCEVRRSIVLARGKIPCDVLFIGEAPGASEDAHGQPFIGPAGKLLDEQISLAISNSGRTELRLCFTNLVCCIPREAPGKGKIGEPPEESIEACSGRLDEFLCISKPRLIVAVGDLSDKVLKDQQVSDMYEKIVHPAAILRAEPVRQPLMNQRVVVTLENSFREV